MQIKKIVNGYLEGNCYIAHDDKKCLLIDPGSDEEVIDKYILKKELKVVGILITHYHFDHVGALDYFREKYKCKVIDHNDVEKLISLSGFTFRVIPTFGHSGDSVSYHFENDNIMFTGDFLFKESIGRYDFEDSDGVEMQKSIKLIKHFPEDTKIYPGHGDNTTLKKELENNIYLKEIE